MPTTEPGFRALLVLGEQRAMPVGRRELHWMSGVESLSIGKTTSRTIEEPRLVAPSMWNFER
jgi:hypothetical protein